MNAQVSCCPISHFGSVHVQLESPGELIKTDRWAPTHRVSDSVSLGWDLRCAFLDDTGSVRRPHFENHSLKSMILRFKHEGESFGIFIISRDLAFPPK